MTMHISRRSALGALAAAGIAPFLGMAPEVAEAPTAPVIETMAYIVASFTVTVETVSGRSSSHCPFAVTSAPPATPPV